LLRGIISLADQPPCGFTAWARLAEVAGQVDTHAYEPAKLR